eukprot:jgi/Mesen1/9988/ME000072S09399
MEIATVEEFGAVFNAGCQRRRTGATGLNDVSSRSHAVLMVSVSRAGGAGGVGRMHLVDLAGNEDNRRTGNGGVRIAESSGINQSLFALSKVVAALINGDSRVPYRDSKLTRLLQDSLGGNSRSLMVACLNPGNYQEAAHTLALGAKSRQVVNHHRHLQAADDSSGPPKSVDMASRLQAWRDVKGKPSASPASLGPPCRQLSPVDVRKWTPGKPKASPSPSRGGKQMGERTTTSPFKSPKVGRRLWDPRDPAPAPAPASGPVMPLSPMATNLVLQHHQGGGDEPPVDDAGTDFLRRADSSEENQTRETLAELHSDCTVSTTACATTAEVPLSVQLHSLGQSLRGLYMMSPAATLPASSPAPTTPSAVSG